MTWLGLNWWEWLLVALGWALIPTCYVVRRWRLRVYLVREIQKVEAVPDEYEACLSCGRPKRVDHICLACGFCGFVTVVDKIPPPSSRLVNPTPAGANEAKDSSQRRRA